MSKYIVLLFRPKDIHQNTKVKLVLYSEEYKSEVHLLWYSEECKSEVQMLLYSDKDLLVGMPMQRISKLFHFLFRGGVIKP